MNDKVYIFGHKKPDTDSVASAIALSYLKRLEGMNAEARVLGDINKETLFALKYFGVEEPKYLNDVKLQLRDIDYHKDFILNEDESIYSGYQYMLREGLTGIPIVSDNNLFKGLITMKDMIYSYINSEDNVLYTSYDNILKTLNGKEIVRFNDEIEGKVLVAGYKSTTFINNVNIDNSEILIVGDRPSIIEYAIKSKAKLIIISNDLELSLEHINLAKENHVNIIVSPFDTFHIAKIVTLSNYIKTMIRSYNTTTFVEKEYVDNFLDINKKLKHTNYPVVNKHNICLGLLRLTDLNNKHPKKVILVDHNEKLQTADGIEEAEILEIIDHHNLGSITTSVPINFRNMSVGSTCTIIYTMYKEKNIEIPKEIAGMMLSGILSDTLILKSPTTTEKDKEAVESLAKIVDIEYHEYGMKMFKAATSLSDMTIEDVLYNDYKLYNVGDTNFAVGQFFTLNFEDMEKDIDKYVEVLDKVSENNDYELVCLYVTDIIKGGSYVIYNNKGKNILDTAYLKDVYEGMFIENCVSRKKDVIPVIMSVLEG